MYIKNRFQKVSKINLSKLGIELEFEQNTSESNFFRGESLNPKNNEANEIFISPLAREVEKNILDNLQTREWDAGSLVKYLIRDLAHKQINYYFLSLSLKLTDNHIRLIRLINTKPHRWNSQTITEEMSLPFPSIQTYLRDLQNEVLLIKVSVSEDTYGITVRGKEYLAFLVHSGL